MNKEQRRKALKHIRAMDDYNALMIEAILNPPKKLMGIQDLIYTYVEPQKTEQELLRENIQKEWKW